MSTSERVRSAGGSRGSGSHAGPSPTAVPIGAPVVVAGAVVTVATGALTWWFAAVHVTVGSGTVLGVGGPTSSLPLGQVPGHTVWVGLLASLLGVAALVAGLAALRLKSKMSRRRLGVATMVIGILVCLVGLLALLRGPALVKNAALANVATKTGGQVSTVEEFEAKLGGNAKVSFDAQPGVGVLAAMLGGIAIAAGGWLLASQPELSRRVRRLSS